MVCLFEGPMTTRYAKANTKQYQQIECSSIFNAKVCMLITYDVEQRKVNFNLFFLSPTYCECDKYDSNTNVHKIISVTLWLALRTFHF
jgi:hypothetical protein